MSAVVTAAQASPVGSRPGNSVRAGGLSASLNGGRSTFLGQAGFGRHHGHSFGRGSRRLNFAGGYGVFGYGAYGTPGYYGSAYGGYAGPLPGAGYLDGPYGPLIVPGYGGIREAPVQPPAIYVIDRPSASASRRRAGRTSATLASLSGRPEQAEARIIEVSRVPRR